MLLPYLSILSIVVGLLSGSISIWMFIESRQHPAFKRRGIVFTAITVIMVLVAIIFANIPLLAGNDSQFAKGTATTTPIGNITPTTKIAPTATFTSIPTLTPLLTPTLVPSPTPFTYTADWSHGSNGWSTNDIWSVYGSALYSSGQGEIPFPFQLEPGSSGTTDYTVEWKCTANNSGYGITMRAGNDGSTYGYHITFNNQDINQDVWIYIFVGPGYISGDYKKLFTVGSGLHDYIISVKANHITIKVDGSTLMQVQDNTFTTGGSSSFISSGQENITYLKFTQQ